MTPHRANPPFELRPYEINLGDDGIISRWEVRRPGTKSNQFPLLWSAGGWFAFREKEDFAAAIVEYDIDYWGNKIALIDDIFTNPNAELSIRKQAMLFLVDTLTAMAEADGYRVLGIRPANPLKDHFYNEIKAAAPKSRNQ